MCFVVVSSCLAAVSALSAACTPPGKSSSASTASSLSDEEQSRPATLQDRVCGDGICELDETATNCPVDCRLTTGLCDHDNYGPGKREFCGDKNCNLACDEGRTCAKDCGVGYCGDGFCDINGEFSGMKESADGQKPNHCAVDCGNIACYLEQLTITGCVDSEGVKPHKLPDTSGACPPGYGKSWISGEYPTGVDDDGNLVRVVPPKNNPVCCPIGTHLATSVSRREVPCDASLTPTRAP